jgi:predicted glycogen debranching enzyme
VTVLGPQACGTLDESARREWLVADGLGGYAMGTVAGLRTRRYHGLLVAAAGGPSARMLGLAALDAVLVVGDARYRLATDEWASGDLDPRGHELLVSFALDRGVPRWRWQVGSIVVEREVAMTHGRCAVGVVHRLVGADRPASLELTPLCTWRSVHGERFAGGDPDLAATAEGFVFEGGYRVAGAGWTAGGAWYRGVRAREEAARGLSDREDLWAAGTFVAELGVGEAHEVTAAASPFADELPAASAIVERARERATELRRQAGVEPGIDAQLVLAADQFVIDHDGPTAVAGYPWVGAGARDLMTPAEGLCLAPGRADEGREALRRAAATLSEGMLANTADTGTLEYNTADGTLWFVHAVGRHLAVTGDDDLGAELAPAIHEILSRHLAGTRFGIGADRDGLLRQGEDGWALTWMDARIDGVPVTPRIGKPVEVNALWVQALEIGGRLAGTERWRDAHAASVSSFLRRFVRADGRGLIDVVDGPSGDDAALRPNQLLAVSLPGGPLAGAGREEAARATVEACRPLVTPLGLRSLAPDDPAYLPYHRGTPAERDRAYHQGTVWPWLAGPYVDAARRVGLPSDELLEGLLRHVGEWGLGSVSETADGAAPHAATGCPFQAWSVAELLRVRRS